jgi:hypothetical protein
MQAAYRGPRKGNGAVKTRQDRHNHPGSHELANGKMLHLDITCLYADDFR